MNRLLVADPPVTTPSEAHRAAAIASVSMGTFLVLMTYTAPLADLPVIAGALGAGTDMQTWLLSSMSVGLAAALLTVGSVADNIGRRRMFVAGTFTFAVSSLMCAVAVEPVLFLVARLVGGIGAAAIVSSSLGIIASVSPTPGSRVRAAGIWGAALGAGGATGPLLAGLLDEVDQWRILYVAAFLLGTAIAWWARTHVVESSAAIRRRIDLAGATLLTVAVVLALVALTDARSGVGPLVLGAAAVAAVLLAAFVAVERRRAAPMIDLGLFRDLGFVAATVGALGTGLSIIGLLSFACTFLMNRMGMSSLHAAALLLAWSGTGTLTALAARWLPPALQGSRQLVIGLLLTAVGEAALLGRLSPQGWGLLPGLVVIGVAYGVLNAALGRQAIATVPAAQAAMGSGANNTARYIGAAIGVTVVVVAVRQTEGGAEAAWNHAVALAAAMSALAALTIAALSLGRRPAVRAGAE